MIKTTIQRNSRQKLPLQSTKDSNRKLLELSALILMDRQASLSLAARHVT
jgi:hypothetical protein